MIAIDSRFEAMIQAGAARQAVSVLSDLALSGPASELARINPIALAAAHGASDDAFIDALVIGSHLGLFEMNFLTICPACGSIVDHSPRAIRALREHAPCSLCAVSIETSLDEMVEVSFCVGRKLRRIAYHSPSTMRLVDYYRYLHWCQNLELSGDWQAFWRRWVIGARAVPRGKRRTLSIDIGNEPVLAFEPVTHTLAMIVPEGEPMDALQAGTIRYTEAGCTPLRLACRPGRIKLTFENETAARILPSCSPQGNVMKLAHSPRSRFLTAKRLFTNQVFRSLYKTGDLRVDQRLKMASLTLLFTDLKSSTELYERVGDLTAFELVDSHFHILTDAVREHGGATVKTIGDAVMATFPSAEQGLAAALHMRDAMDRFNAAEKREALTVKIGLHQGPCLAVLLNERLDYFGQTVNIAARVQALATARPIFATESVVCEPGVQRLIAERALTSVAQQAALKGVSEAMTVYEIA